MGFNGPKVSIPSEHYTLLAQMAAELAGVKTARAGRFTHPGDPLGTILCEAWRVDLMKMNLVMASYMSALLAECGRLQVSPPSLADVLAALPNAVNSARFPDVDLDAMTGALARNVPVMFGKPI